MCLFCLMLHQPFYTGKHFTLKISLQNLHKNSEKSTPSFLQTTKANVCKFSLTFVQVLMYRISRISTKVIFSKDCTKFLVKTKVYNFILTIAMCPSHPISEHQLEAGRGLAGSAPHVLSEDSVSPSLRWTLIQ